MVLEVSNIKYELKYGYRAVAKEGVLKKIATLQKIIGGLGDNEDSYGALSDVLEILAEVISVGLKDYDKDVDDTMDLLETYFEENADNEEISVIGLYGNILNELVNNAFLVKMFPKEIKEILKEAGTETVTVKKAAPKRVPAKKKS